MPTTIKKTTTTKKPAAPKKPKAAAKEAVSTDAPAKDEAEQELATSKEAVITQDKVEKAAPIAELNLPDGRYAWAVGRRKTSVANVRLYLGKGKNTVNKKDILVYFGNKSLVERAFKPLSLTGMESRVYLYANIKGGGLNSQSEALSHAIATAMAKNQPEFRKVLKKNGTLTRDSRMKERKKPGLKGARRGSQWAKR